MIALLTLPPSLAHLDFPEVEEANELGLLALGGDLSVNRLLVAYRSGIYPCFLQDEPIQWWSPDPRTVLFPEDFRVSRSLRKSIRNKNYQVSINRAFRQVVENCASSVRKTHSNSYDHESRADTWITADMIAAYCELHRLGVAHSVETWQDSILVGGLYGVSIGSVFCGESMFSKSTDASKVALFHLVEKIKQWGFSMIDCQQPSQHLFSLGAVMISRNDFLELLHAGLNTDLTNVAWKSE